MVVSTERPWSTAQSDEPLPRWQLTSRSSFGRRFEKLRGAQADVVVRRAVEAVAAHALLFVELVGQAVEIGVGRQRVVKRRVEHGDVRHGGKQPPHLANAGDVHRVVQRRERIERLDLRQHLVGDERSFRELLAAMHDAMRDDADLARAADDARLLRREFRDHRLERLGEAALRQLAFHFALRAAMHEPRAVDADALDQTARLARFVGRVVETVFERRRAAVDDENLLGSLALELEAVGIIALAKRGGRLRRIGHDRFHPLGDGPRDVLHRARLGHDDGLEQRHRNQQHLAARLGDEVRQQRDRRSSAPSRRTCRRPSAARATAACRRRRGPRRAIVPLSTTPKCVASAPWWAMASFASNDPTREPSTKCCRRSAEKSWNG